MGNPKLQEWLEKEIAQHRQGVEWMEAEILGTGTIDAAGRRHDTTAESTEQYRRTIAQLEALRKTDSEAKP